MLHTVHQVWQSVCPQTLLGAPAQQSSTHAEQLTHLVLSERLLLLFCSPVGQLGSALGFHCCLAGGHLLPQLGLSCSMQGILLQSPAALPRLELQSLWQQQRLLHTASAAAAETCCLAFAGPGFVRSAACCIAPLSLACHSLQRDIADVNRKCRQTTVTTYMQLF